MDKKLENNPTWKKQAKALSKQQLHFPVLKDVETKVRIEAAKIGENPSNTIRRILELDVKPPIRPRVGASFSEEEMIKLAERYDLKAFDQKTLIKRITEVINGHFDESLGNNKP